MTPTSETAGPGAIRGRPPRVVLTGALALTLAACATAGPTTTLPPATITAPLDGAPARPGGARPEGRRTLIGEGRASYYSNIFNGRRTASGERYDPERLTAAHKSLPLGTWVRVTRRDGRWVEVKVNDRCGCGGGHIIDLSRAAARKLDMIHSGTAAVRLEIVQR
ncbi:MAG TPA: septal ring lytic transglycosylase RlpA family protein [Polyangia bacterium]|jgi:rare lipoprotein A|nr:septal ring lytic transglycosylase RlpA family protein [Polyangia bacterium]